MMTSMSATKNASHAEKRAEKRASDSGSDHGSEAGSDAVICCHAPGPLLPNGLVYWYDEFTGRKFKHSCGNLVVLFNNGHRWEQRTGTYHPLVFTGASGPGDEATLHGCRTLGDACKTHRAFDVRGF